MWLYHVSNIFIGISFEEFQVHDDSCLDLQGLENQKFAIFVSFAEIYNEFIYDLLVETPVRGKHRTPLKITQDKHKNFYIKGTLSTSLILCFMLCLPVGLHEVQVNNIDEAMLMLRLGLKHRHVASTRLNYQSSRSHSIYTIKLVKLANLPDQKKPFNALINR